MTDKCILVIVGFGQNRGGLEEDLDKICSTFKNLFDIKDDCIVELIDRSEQDIVDQFGSFANEEWRERMQNAKLVAVFCLAHGQTEGRVVLGNNEVADARQLLLNPLFKIEELDGKLKWLVVQSCRGKINNYRPMQRDGKAKYFPDYYFISYCTGEGTASFQNDNNGKIYIQKLCAELRTNINRLTLFEMLTNVAAAVDEHYTAQHVEKKPKPTFFQNKLDYRF